MSEDKDPLDELIVDENKPVDKAVLAEILKGEVTISKDGEIRFSEKYHTYKQWKRVILYLLARKVVVTKGIKKMEEGASQSIIGEGSMMPPKSAGRTIIYNLKGLVKKNKGLYIIPNYNLIRCRNILQGKEKIPNIRKKKTK